MQFSKQTITNSVQKVLSEGCSTSDTLDLFLMMKMINDTNDPYPFDMRGLSRFVKRGPSPSEIQIQLLGNGIIEDNDIQMRMSNGSNIQTPHLIVKLSPSCSLHAETTGGYVEVDINNKPLTTMHISNMSAEDIALWIIRQKQNLDSYMEEWETVLARASKKAKGNRMSMLAIKAIVTEAMKEYPAVRYELIEQKRRMRIKVYLPNCRLGVFIDAWWGTYKDRLPAQLASLKTLIEAHSKSTLTDFFISNR